MNGTMLSKADRGALENLWGEAGSWVADTWTELGGLAFDGRLRYRGVVWGLTPNGGRLGHTGETGRITLHPAILDPQDQDRDGKVWGVPVARLGEGYARDVLLHEMIHAWIAQTVGPWSDPHNSAEWTSEITRVSKLVGLGAIKAQPVKARRLEGKVTKQPLDGFLTQGELASWPHSLRDPAYYLERNRKIAVPV